LNDPRELLGALAADVDRLVDAGAAAASADEALGRRAPTFRDLARQVPALRPIAEGIERVHTPDPRSAGRALLNLALMVRQARAALATAGVAGPIEPIEPGGGLPLRSLAPSRDVYAVIRALAEGGSGRPPIIQDAIERGVCADPWLLDPLMDALADPYLEVADLVAERALPSFGRAALPALLGRRDP
jgi:hypothetical protein